MAEIFPILVDGEDIAHSSWDPRMTESFIRGKFFGVRF